jgi:hypothetical protein
MTYKIKPSTEYADGFVIETSTSAWIPMDQANVMYQAYLEWVAEGNVAEEFSEPET